MDMAVVLSGQPGAFSSEAAGRRGSRLILIAPGHNSRAAERIGSEQSRCEV
jgi:hypothetical protein